MLSDKGRELSFVIGALPTWGSRHVHSSAALVSDDSRHEVHLRYFCPACGTRVRGSTVTVRNRARAPTPRQLMGKLQVMVGVAEGLRDRREPP